MRLIGITFLVAFFWSPSVCVPQARLSPPKSQTIVKGKRPTAMQVNDNRIENVGSDSVPNGYLITNLKDLEMTGPVYCDSIFPDSPKEGQPFHTELTDYKFRNGKWYSEGDDMGIPACK